MAEPKSAPQLGKGQIRCFRCRCACALKNGNWHSHASQQQVFLCNACEREIENGASPSAPAPAQTRGR